MKRILLTALFLSMSAAQAARPTHLNTENYPWMSDQEFSTGKVQAQERAGRNIAANSELNDQLLSKEFKAFRTKFLAIQNASELEALISALDKNYQGQPDDLKLITALLTPLLEFRAFTYRIYPFLSKEKLTHSIMLSQVQNAASFMSMNLPTAQWKAGFDYVTQPMVEDDLKRFDTTDDLQDFLVTKVYPAYLNAAKRISALNFSKHHVAWDNKLFFGTSSFTDNFQRYQLVGEGERLSLLASLHYSLSDISKFISYEANDLPKLMAELASLYGYDSLFSAVDGVSAQKVAAVIKKSAYKKLFTLRESGEKNMMTAYHHLKEGARFNTLAWHELKDRKNDNQNIIRSALFLPLSQNVKNGVENMEKIVSSKTSVRSDITGEVVTVDLPAYFAHPPQDLKSMLPIEFDSGPKTQTNVVKMKNGATKKIVFRNYFSGRAVNWNVAAYKNLLPDLNKGSQVAQSMKIINQAPGTVMPALIMNPFMLY
jgi:hypothetical protein